MFNIYLPAWITLATIEYHSEMLWGYLAKRESVPLTTFRQEWDLSVTSLHGALPGLVFVSKQYPGDLRELAGACAASGHVPFYDDALLTLRGDFEQSLLVPAIDGLIKRSVEVRNEREHALRRAVGLKIPVRNWRKELGF